MARAPWPIHRLSHWYLPVVSRRGGFSGPKGPARHDLTGRGYIAAFGKLPERLRAVAAEEVSYVATSRVTSRNDAVLMLKAGWPAPDVSRLLHIHIRTVQRLAAGLPSVDIQLGSS